MLKLEGVRAGYGRTTVLDGLDLEVSEGDMVALLGRNGVGKTTTLRAIMGEVSPTAGRIAFAGRDVTRAPTHARARGGLAYVPQGRQIFPALSVAENLRVVGYAAGGRDWRARMHGLLEEFPVLATKLDAPGASLSGGQQQILALARALMSAPRALLLDEPSEGIQPSIVDEIAEVVGALNRERGITVVLVEQNLDFAARVARHAYLMDKGRIVRDLPSQQILEDRELQHEYMGV
jgi:urea ABC transporter ATP-binding protein UrtE